MNQTTARALLLLLVTACGGAVSTSPPVAQVALPPPAPPIVEVVPDAGAPGAFSEEDAAVPIAHDDATWGSRTAPATIVVFGDFQCPYTAKAMVTLRELQAQYGPDSLRVVWKNEPLPFHTHAKPAAEAATVVRAIGGDAAFWRFHELAFANQDQLSTARFEAWAQAAGVPVDVFQARLADPATAARVDDDHALAKRLEINGTPTFFINGVVVTGAQVKAKFVEVIDEEIAKAKERLASGTSPDRVYAELAHDNYEARPKKKADADVPDTVVWSVPVAGAPVRGAPNAVVTIVEFADFQCPFCRRVEPTLAQIRSVYGDKVRLVWRDHPLPFHPRAQAAATLAREARAEKGLEAFWTVHDALFDALPHLEESDLDAIATAPGST